MHRLGFVSGHTLSAAEKRVLSLLQHMGHPSIRHPAFEGSLSHLADHYMSKHITINTLYATLAH